MSHCFLVDEDKRPKSRQVGEASGLPTTRELHSQFNHRKRVPGTNPSIRNSAVSRPKTLRSEEALGLPCHEADYSCTQVLRLEGSLKFAAILQKDQDPEHRRYQCRSNARRRKRQMKRKDVVQLRRKHRERERHKEA